VALAAPSRARASDDDGAYGRFDGDLALSLGSGVAVAKGGPHLAFDLHALYLSTAGLYARYTDGLGQHRTAMRRTIATGVELRPLFLARWAKDMEHGPAHLDLLLDSISIGLGAVWQEPQRAPFAAKPGLELGIGLEMPILSSATGPFVGAMGLLRLDDPSVKNDRDILDQGSMLLFTVSWHQMVPAHLVDARDRRPRP
jgi:hypothetical protein